MKALLTNLRTLLFSCTVIFLVGYFLFSVGLKVEVEGNSQVTTVTHYQAERRQTDSTPHITANMTKVRPGIVAVSRDLHRKGFKFGKKVRVCNFGVYEIQDLMNSRMVNSVDIYTNDKELQKEIGKQKCKVTLLEEYKVKIKRR